MIFLQIRGGRTIGGSGQVSPLESAPESTMARAENEVCQNLASVG
jgi:hypothetical protein